MNQENMQINAVADSYAMQFVGICHLFSLTNEQKEILFSDFSAEQAYISGEILKLISPGMTMDAETVAKFREQMKGFGAVSVRSQHIIFKMSELVDTFKTYGDSSEENWHNEFRHWLGQFRSEDPYRGTYQRYITRHVYGKPPAFADVIERLESLMLELTDDNVDDIISDREQYCDRTFLTDEETGDVLYDDVEEIHNSEFNPDTPDDEV